MHGRGAGGINDHWVTEAEPEEVDLDTTEDDWGFPVFDTVLVGIVCFASGALLTLILTGGQ